MIIWIYMYMEGRMERRKEGKKDGWMEGRKEGRKNYLYLKMHSTDFIYGYMASHIWQRTTQEKKSINITFLILLTLLLFYLPIFI